MELIFTSAFFAVIGCVLLYYWRITLSVLALIVLMVSCSRADTLEVSAIIESDADRNTMQDAVDYAGRIFRTQLGMDLRVTFVDVSTVAGHTNAQFLLDAVKTYRIDHAQHRAADATVLFTRREMRGYAGIATVGPACSASASAIVAIRNDGYDGQILAHELLHTVGVPHDHSAGWLMSESLSRAGSDTVSSDSLLTFKASGVSACTAEAKAAPAASAPSQPTGGGGGMGEALLAILCVIAALRQYCRAERRDEAANHWLKKYRQLRRDLRKCDAVLDEGVIPLNLTA